MGEKVYGLLGRKLGHSWSAPIHAALGCADYRLIELEPEELGAEVSFFQSNHEGALVDAIQQAYFDRVDGIIINPAAYTHTSVALLDAVKAVGIPAVEVHVSDPDSREDFRHVSYIRAACIATIRGHGLPGYLEALRLLCERGEGRG